MADKLIPSGTLTSDLLNEIEHAAVAAARDVLTGRRILDVKGPSGLALTSVEVGNDDLRQEPSPGEASAVVSQALSVPMIYRRFSLSKRRVAAFEETGQPLNLKVVEDAGQAVAAREEEFVYHGQPGFHLQGLLTVDGRNNLKGGNWNNVDEVLDNVIEAVNMLDGKGYSGPLWVGVGAGLIQQPVSSLCRHRPAANRALKTAMHARYCQGDDRGWCLGRDRSRVARPGSRYAGKLLGN